MGAPASPQVIGRYILHGKIASGGMATVHFGRLVGAAGFSRTVAIKRLHPHLADEPEFLSTLIDEARLAARIHHPNVVPTLDVESAEGELLVVMEYVRGESLARLLRAESARGRRLPLSIASAIVIGALHGLHAAHEATSDRGAPLGIVHRDVSPHNILVGVDGMARLIDFGVAKAAGRLQTTAAGVVKGKMAYMAPEQLAAREVTRAVDVYSMGVVLWETLTGRRLFPGDNDAALFGRVLAGAKEPPSSVVPSLSPELDAIVMKALAPEPEARFATAEAMAELLRRVVPPAFPTDVGRWVDQVASEAIAQRGALLAEIESSSGVVQVPVPSSRRAPRSLRAAIARPQPKEGEDDAPTIASQPSSLSVETPRPSVARAWRTRRARLAGAVGGAILLVVGVTAVVWRSGGSSSPAAETSAEPASSMATGGPPAQPASSTPVVGTVAQPAPGAASPAPLAAPAAAPVAVASDPPASATAPPPAPLPPPPTAVPTPSVAAAPVATPPPPTPVYRPPVTVAKPRPAPTPKTPIRFAQPD
jgi:serine/threonine protein kinase